MALTDAAARAAKPRDGKLTKFSDGAGLQLWAHPSGKRSWHACHSAGRWAAARFDATRLGPILEAIHERLSGVTIECLDWRVFLERWDRPGALL